MICLFPQDRAERAARMLRKILNRRPEALDAYSALAAAYGFLGDAGRLTYDANCYWPCSRKNDSSRLECAGTHD